MIACTVRSFLRFGVAVPDIPGACPRGVILDASAGQVFFGIRVFVPVSETIFSAISDRCPGAKTTMLIATGSPDVRRTADFYIITVSRYTAANARAVHSARRGHFAAADGDVLTISIKSAADARAFNSTGCNNFTAADGDVRTGFRCTAADARARCSAGRGHFAAADGDARTGSNFTAADACAALSAGCGHFTAADGDALAGSITPAANSRTAWSAGCGYFAAADGDVRTGFPIASADARAVLSAGCLQLAAVLILIVYRQRTGILLLQAGTVLPAFDAVFPVQLNCHIAFAFGFDSRGIRGITYIDSHAVKSHFRRGAGVRDDCDGIG